MTKNEFLNNVDNACNHRFLLWDALEATDGNIIEFGSGHGSTPFLKAYANDSKRNFESFENNQEWANATGANFITDWDSVNFNHCSVLLIDHAPGERRKIDIKRFSNHCDIMIVHDTEPAADHGYQMRGPLSEFKFIKEYQSAGAWATMVSNNEKFSHLFS